MRPITTAGYAGITTPTDVGPAAVLQWLKISDLVVDPSYQREIQSAGRSNVRRIASAFSWAKFAPVIVSPVEGGKFAIVDGQHRTTAAALCGLEQVPCAVIMVDRSGQAAAFKAINGATTKVSPMAMFHAAVTAGDPEALALKEVCDCAGVRILRYPIQTDAQEPGDTMAASAIERLLKRHGRATMITALQCVTQTSEGNPGLLVAPVIAAIADVLAEEPAWRDAGSKLLDVFDAIDLDTELDAARVTAAKRPNISIAVALANRLRDRLSKSIPVAEAA
ncbi:MAG TPA: DUF6551 family protein [Microvirga sp.]|jgi:hypothetical protein|nr:DUF6551 family protein [Microvirga sp.]